MKKSFAPLMSGLLGTGLCLVTVWINFSALSEAYGSGPPHYSRTTNMDKWVDQLPYLIPVDLLRLGIAVIAVRFSLKKLGAVQS